VPHPFRFFLRKGWDTNEICVYTLSENALTVVAWAVLIMSHYDVWCHYGIFVSLMDGVEYMDAIELQARTRMSEKGRVVIPVEMRKALGMDVGGVLVLRVEDGELRISTMRSRLRRAQEWVRQFVPPGVSLADELSAERREAAKHE
jgi:antitoxin PrlF